VAGVVAGTTAGTNGKAGTGATGGWVASGPGRIGDGTWVTDEGCWRDGAGSRVGHGLAGMEEEPSSHHELQCLLVGSHELQAI
jgi:hypothetical protein